MQVPFLVTSATLPPLVLAQVRSAVHIRRDNSYHVNLGTDRSNIAWFVHDMSGGKSDLEALNFLIPTGWDCDGGGGGLTQTMVFFDDISLAMEARKWICNRLPSELGEQVAVYHSRRSKNSKRRVLREFRLGEIKILLTTDAAGMGCDLPHIEQVVQFMVPNTLPIWMQRAGRAGRSAAVAARAILLVQPSVFQEIKSTKNEIGDSRAYRKSIEDGLREWITTEECRRDVADQYFGSVGIPRHHEWIE
ncbi:P-loop containing nucleoside triphosphate hydrolase protein [Infundibulicybe gibba]|nr:P-loop containing nucleoside triphosphate hydrolase protein [Infundibulicybe gibba]